MTGFTDFSPEILYNAIMTPDGTILESRSRHDYVDHTDANGSYYAVDGGLDYLRRAGPSDYTELSLHSGSPIEELREKVCWGRRYDKDKKLLEKIEWIKIKDLDDDHLDAIIDYPGVSDRFKLLLIREKQYRNDSQ